jgi:A/G-specific adenine glycosylase
MELGALVCRPQAPRCRARQPEASGQAGQRGWTHRLPRRRAAKRVPMRNEAAAIVRRGGRVAMVRRADRGLLAGLWELPTAVRHQDEPAETAATRAAAAAGLVVRPEHTRDPVVHAFSHFRLRLTPVLCRLEACRKPQQARWFDAGQVRSRPLSTVHRRILEEQPA